MFVSLFLNCKLVLFSFALVASVIIFLCCYSCGSSDEIEFDEPDETITLDGNTVEWDLYDSVDLIEGTLFKYEFKADHPKGHVYLDSIYHERPITEVNRWILVSRANNNVFLLGAGTDTTDDPRKPYHSNYGPNSTDVSIHSAWLDEWRPFRNYSTVLAKIVGNDSNYYFRLIFPENVHKFYFKRFSEL